MYTPFAGLATQFKLLKHLDACDVHRVKDYYLTCCMMWPVVHACPIDPLILARARTFLKAQGWVARADKSRGVILTAPDGAEYASHCDGVPKLAIA